MLVWKSGCAGSAGSFDDDELVCAGGSVLSLGGNEFDAASGLMSATGDSP